MTVNDAIDYVLVANPTSASVNVGSTVSVQADVYRVVNGVRESSPVASNVSVSSWSSSATNRATVSSSGVVTGVSAGTAYISATATYQGQTLTTTGNDRCLVTVVTVTTYRLRISPDNTELAVTYVRTYVVYRDTYVNGTYTASTAIPNTDVNWAMTAPSNASYYMSLGTSGSNAGKATGLAVTPTGTLVTVTATLKSSAQYYSSYESAYRSSAGTVKVVRDTGTWGDNWENGGSGTLD